MKRLSPDILRLVAPGTKLREGIERVIKAGKGALIVVGSDETVEEIRSGGFRLRIKLTPQHMSEVAKMDGAIIIDEKAEQILWANVHLMPSSSLDTSETGTRHRTADRVSQQSSRVVITVSESMQIVSVFDRGDKFVLDNLTQVMFRGNQAVSTLERYRFRLDEVALHLTHMELESNVMLSHVTNVLQLAERVRRIREEINYAILSLGDQGHLLELQRDELMLGVEEITREVISDYAVEGMSTEVVLGKLKALPDSDLLHHIDIAGCLGLSVNDSAEDRYLIPRGYRVLHHIPRLPTVLADKVVDEFNNFDSLREATLEELDEIEGIGKSRAKMISEGIARIAEVTRRDVRL